MNMTRTLRGIAVVTLLLLAVVCVQAQEIRTVNGTKIGRVHDDGRIEGANGARLGSAKNVRMVWTAAYWFFFFR